MPVVGSMDYSIIPMAHAGLAILGEGEIYFGGKRRSAGEVLEELGMKPFQPGTKDGISFINGVAAPLGMSCNAIVQAMEILNYAQLIGSCSFEILRGRLDSLDPAVSNLKKHQGLAKCAHQVRMLLDDSGRLREFTSSKVQDATSLRALTTIHGAIHDQMANI